MNLRLLLPVYINVENYVVLLCYVVSLGNFYLSILEALVLVILLGKRFSSGYHVWCNLRTFQQTEFLLKVLTL